MHNHDLFDQGTDSVFVFDMIIIKSIKLENWYNLIKKIRILNEFIYNLFI